MFTDDDLKQAEHYEVLGPAYFAARRVAEQLMAGVESEPLKAVLKKCADDLTSGIYEYVEDQMRSDLERNLQGHIQDMVERTVRALLSGEEWAMRQYPLSHGYDAEKIRAAIAKHCGDRVLAARVAELEKTVERQAESLKWERDRCRY